MTNVAARKTTLETILSDIAGKPVELTFRGPTSFTVSTDDVTPDLGEKVSAFFGKLATVTVDHDEECGTCAYIEAA